MRQRNKKWCQTDVVTKAIQKAVPGFTHTCGTSRNNAVYVRGSQIDGYCMAVNGTTTDLLPTGQYKLCHQLAVNVIKRKLDNNSSVRTTKIDSNNITATEEVHADSNNNNNMGFVLLVPKEEDGVDEGYQERCRVASIQFAAERSAACSNHKCNNKSNRLRPRIRKDYNAERC